MAEGEIHEDDIGTVFEVTVQDESGIVDISGATTKEIIFRKPDETVVTKTASFTSDGTDGKIRYSIIADDLNMVGKWSIQGKVIIPAGTWHTDIDIFQVYPNL